MNSTIKSVRIVGVLFIVQMVTAVLSYSVILEPILYQTNFLSELSDNSTMVTTAMILDLVCGASVFAIAVLLFPILKHFSEHVAIWYLGLRLAELISFVVSGLLLLTLLKIGQEIGNASGMEAGHLESIAIYLRRARSSLQDISLLVYCLGAWSFYGLLFYSRLIPRFISGWGLIGVTLLFIEILANVYGTSLGGVMIMMPLGLNELFLGIWLITKGFQKERLPTIINNRP